MNREEEKARSVLGAEAMSDAMWEWGDEYPQATSDEIAGKAALLMREYAG